MIARRSRKRKPVWIVYVEGLMDKVTTLSWKEKEKFSNLYTKAQAEPYQDYSVNRA